LIGRLERAEAHETAVAMITAEIKVFARRIKDASLSYQIAERWAGKRR